MIFTLYMMNDHDDKRKDKKCEIRNVKFIGNQNSY